MIAKIGAVFDNGNLVSLLVMALRASTLAIKFLLTLFIAKYLGFEALGFYGLVAAAGVMAPSLLGFGLMYNISRRAVTQSTAMIVDALNHYARFILSIYTLILILALVIGLYLENIYIVMVTVLIIILEHLNNETYFLLLNLSHPLLANILHFLRSALGALVFMAVSLDITGMRNLETLLTFWLLGSAMAFAGFILFVRKWPWVVEQIWPSKSWFLNEFKVSKINYMNSIASTSSQYVYHMLITFFLGLELTGVYVFFVQATGAMNNLIHSSVIQLARPVMIRAHIANDAAYFDIHRHCVKKAFLVAVLMALIAYPVMYITTFYLVDKPMVEQWFPIFSLILIVFIASVMKDTNDLVFYSQHRDQVILRLSLCGIGLGLLTNTLVIPVFGLWGAVAAGLIVNLSLIALQLRWIGRRS